MEENVKYYTQCNKDIFHAPADLQAQAFDLKAIKNCPKDITFEIKCMDEDLDYGDLEKACQNYILQNGYEDEIGKGYIFYSCQRSKGEKGLREYNLTKDKKVADYTDTLMEEMDDKHRIEVVKIALAEIPKEEEKTIKYAIYEYKYVLVTIV